MRCLDRNKRTFWYARALKPESLTDEEGYLTGEHDTPYSLPQEARGNISAAVGEAEVLQFGNDVSYDRTIVVEGTDLPIDETSVLWVDVKPRINGRDSPYDYVVKKVAKSLNVTAIAISKVNVS